MEDGDGKGGGCVPLRKERDSDHPIKVMVCGIQTSQIFYLT
jgi:hypothetical protein